MTKPLHSNKDHMSKDEAPYGFCLLSRDKKTWGDEGTGSEAIDPDSECENGCPHYNDRDHNSKEDIIHLNIASFRDRLCPRTLYNLFHKAANPKRIYVRIIQQVDHSSGDVDDADCWDEFCKNYPPCEPYKKQVRIWTMDAKSAKGPTDPRSKLSAAITYDYENPDAPLLQPVHTNEYCMQTDSHMDFNQDFDLGMIDMFHRARNDYAVLSTYVAPMEQTDANPVSVPHLCMVHLTGTWRNWGTKSCDRLVRPKMTNIPWGAGLSFGKCHAEVNVPYDPYLPNIFDGEELSRGFRYFTHGYDVYTPDKVLITHDYHGHQGNPHVHTWGHGGGKSDNAKNDDMSIFMKEIDKFRDSVEPKGTKRVNIIMGLAKEDALITDTINKSRFGVGTRRTLQQAIEFSGFDPILRRMVKNKCGNLHWVPFEESNNYGVDDTLARPLWNEGSIAIVENNKQASVRGASPSIQPAPSTNLSFKSSASNLSRTLKVKLQSEHNALYSLLVILLILTLLMTMLSRSRIHNVFKSKKTARMIV